jgi:hypothetical protein
MRDEEELLDCVFSVDEMLSEAEEALGHKAYTVAMHKLKEAREAIDELREDDEALDDRQEVDMDVARSLK